MASTHRPLVSLALAGWIMFGCSSGDPASSAGRGSNSSSSATPSKTGSRPAEGADGGTAATAGHSFGNSDAAVPGTSTSNPNNGLDVHTCARAELYVERIRPRIVFLIDSSSSMSEDLGGVSRWDALRGALLGTAGLVPTLQDLVKFGLITYQGPRYTTCPAYRYAAPAPGNFKLVDSAFPDAPPMDSSTPTGAAMDWAIDNAFLDQVPSPDKPWEPQFMIFATDGEPNGCSQGSAGAPPLDFDSVIAAAHKASARAIKVFVISLAEATGMFSDHLKEVAKIGGTDTVYSPRSKDDLVRELETIIGTAISCQVMLNAGRVISGGECKGEVTLNSKPLECNGADGWELVDSTHLLLKGKACTDFKLTPSAMVGASFPCEALH